MFEKQTSEPDWDDSRFDPEKGIGRQLIAVFGVVALLAAAWFGGRAFVSYRAQRVLIVPAPMGQGTPADVDIPYSSFTIESDGRQLQAWLVRADTSEPAPAILIFHGNRTSIAALVGSQLALYESGITSMVFDYSGFGHSTGEPSVDRLRRDAVRAFEVFVDSVGRGPATKKFVLGTTLGGAVLMDIIGHVQPSVEGVILVGTFASSRRTAIRQGRVPRIVSFLLPDFYNNVNAAAHLQKPLLVLHSEQDELFPISEADEIVQAAPGKSRLVLLAGMKHDEYLTTATHWDPVINFIKSN